MPTMAAVALAMKDGDGASLDIDIFRQKAQGFGMPQPRSVEDSEQSSITQSERSPSRHLPDESRDLVGGENLRRILLALVGRDTALVVSGMVTAGRTAPTYALIVSRSRPLA